MKCCRREVVAPSSSKAINKIKSAHVSHIHVSAGWRRSWCWLRKCRSQPSTWHLQKVQSVHRAERFMKGSAWELFKQGFNGSYLLMALQIFRNTKVCSHLYIQAPAKMTGAVIILSLLRLKTCKNGYFKSRKGGSFLHHLFTCCFSVFCSLTRTCHCSSKKSFQEMLFVIESKYCSPC